MTLAAREVRVAVDSLATLQRILAELQVYQRRAAATANTEDYTSRQHQQQQQQHLRTSRYAAVSTESIAAVNSSLNSSPGVKEAWIGKQMQARQREFTDLTQLHYFVGSWNVNGRLPAAPDTLADLDLSVWLLQNTKSSPDLYFIGLQEMDLSAEALLMTESRRDDVWLAAVETVLGPRGYQKLVSKQMVGMLLIVYARRSLISAISDVSVDSAGCGKFLSPGNLCEFLNYYYQLKKILIAGIMGMMGNKGAVACRFRLMDSLISVVNSHLAADSKQVDRRNQDYAEICKRISFSQPVAASGADLSSAQIWDCDQLIWMGDLNYRINLSDSEMKSELDGNTSDAASGKLYMTLIKRYDQLTAERLAGRAFAAFDEGLILFPPTYKYEPGTCQFAEAGEKRRTPSWCDRVLWRRNDPLRLLDYRSLMTMCLSDHKPVSALFEADVKRVQPDRRSRVRNEIMRELDKFENESLPDARLDRNQLDFGQVRYGQAKSLSVQLENTGRVPAEIRFIPKLDEQSFAPAWLWLSPPMSMLMPGERLTVMLTCLIDDRLSLDVQSGRLRLDDILILHLENGKDFFISVQAQFLGTAFGLPLSVLLRLPEPIRHYKHSDISAVLSSGTCTQTSPLTVPKEMWRMVDYLYRFGLGVQELFLTSGDAAVMETIRECLDTGREFPLGSQGGGGVDKDDDDDYGINGESRRLIFLHSMAECLIRFLESLAVPVVPFGAAYQRCLDGHQTFALAKNALTFLPVEHYNSFVYLTAFLREMLAATLPAVTGTSSSNDNNINYNNHDINNDDAAESIRERVAAVFSAVMLRTSRPVADKFSVIVGRKKTLFLLHFLRPKL